METRVFWFSSKEWFIFSIMSFLKIHSLAKPYNSVQNSISSNLVFQYFLHAPTLYAVCESPYPVPNFMFCKSLKQEFYCPMEVIHYWKEEVD